jgi:DNA-binding transcriptional ArsR family regulator
MDQLSSVFTSLSDPTRRRIIELLRPGDATVDELTRHFAISQPAISRHLKVLESAAIISRVPRGTSRLSHLELQPLEYASAWIGAQRTWTDRMDRLQRAVREAEKGTNS